MLMKKVIILILVFFFQFLQTRSQSTPSDAIRQFIDYNNPVIAFQHALLIDGTGNSPVPAEVPSVPQPTTTVSNEPRTPFPPRDIGGTSMRTLTRDPLEKKG